MNNSKNKHNYYPLNISQQLCYILSHNYLQLATLSYQEIAGSKVEVIVQNHTPNKG